MLSESIMALLVSRRHVNERQEERANWVMVRLNDFRLCLSKLDWHAPAVYGALRLIVFIWYNRTDLNAEV